MYVQICIYSLELDIYIQLIFSSHEYLLIIYHPLFGDICCQSLPCLFAFGKPQFHVSTMNAFLILLILSCFCCHSSLCFWIFNTEHIATVYPFPLLGDILYECVPSSQNSNTCFCIYIKIFKRHKENQFIER